MSQNLSCPQIFITNGGELPIAHMDVDISVTVTVATVQIRTIFYNHSTYPVSGIYKAPNNHGQANISSCEITFPGKRLVTSVINPEVIKNVQHNPNPDVEVFDPLAFSMGFENCPPNSEVVVTVNYLQDLDFNRAGKYQLVVPTCIPNALLMNINPRFPDLCSIRCVLDVGALQCQWSSSTHAMGVTHSAGPCVTLESQPGTRNNQFFQLEYSAYSPSMTGTCLVQQSAQQRGNFVTFISPPTSYAPNAIVGRDMVFMLDRSGSMFGMPMQEAKKALIIALQMLTVQDRFAICAFDNQMEWFGVYGGASPILVSPNPQNVAMALQWVQAVEARGTTDILTPYQVATNMLANAAPQHEANNGNSWAVSPAPTISNIPVIFLITDGAVRNEHEICNYSQQQATEWTKRDSSRKTIRTFTYGIGPYVNQFFLKILAQKGRGYSHVCLHQDRIEITIVELMNRSQNPLLVNVFLDIPASAGVLHKSPSICPDLYHGCPIVLCGTFTGNFPTQIFATGIDSTGQLVRLPINVRNPYTNGNVNLGVAYAVSFMDSQVADYWMYHQEGNISAAEKCKESAIATSMDSSVPCVFTQTVAYETSDHNSTDASKDSKKAKGQKGMSNGAVVAGGLVFLAVAATSVVMFGNVGATTNNLPVASVFSALSSMSIDASVLHTVVDGLSTAGRGLGQAAGHLGGIISNAAGPVGNGIVAAGQAVGQGVGNVGGKIGNNLAPVAQTMGSGVKDAGANMVGGNGCCCSIVNTLCPCCNGCGDCVGDIGVCGCCVSVFEFVGGCVKDCGVGDCCGDIIGGAGGCISGLCSCELCGSIVSAIDFDAICNCLGMLGGMDVGSGF